MSLLTSLLEQKQTRQAKLANEYARLVVQIAACDDGFTESEAEEILQGAGKTVENLFHDSQIERRRKQLREEIALAKRLGESRREVVLEIERANQKLEQAKQERKAAVRPLFAKLEEIQRATTSATAARRQLREIAPKELDDQREQLQRQIQEINRRKTALRQDLSSAEARLFTARHTGNGQVPRLEKSVQRAMEKLKSIQIEASTLLRRQNQIIEAMER